MSVRQWSERIADKGAHLAGEPFAQFAALIASIVWIAAGGSLSALSVALSIAAITLTQLVLNQQRRREAALHIKIDELIKAETGARSELAGIEDLSEEDIRALRNAPALEDGPPQPARTTPQPPAARKTGRKRQA